MWSQRVGHNWATSLSLSYKRDGPYEIAVHILNASFVLANFILKAMSGKYLALCLSRHRTDYGALSFSTVCSPASDFPYSQRGMRKRRVPTQVTRKSLLKSGQNPSGMVKQSAWCINTSHQECWLIVLVVCLTHAIQVPDTCILTHLTITTRFYYYSHFTDEGNEIQKD